MHRRSGAGQFVNLVDLHVQREGDVVAEQFEVRTPQQVRNVFLGAGVEVAHAQYILPGAHQPVAQVRAQESRAAR